MSPDQFGQIIQALTRIAVAIERQGVPSVPPRSVGIPMQQFPARADYGFPPVSGVLGRGGAS